MDVRHPEVTVRLVGTDGNAYAILGKVLGALKGAGVEQAERDMFLEKAMSGGYDDLLQTVMKWVVVE